ncbi:MAG: radical SAM protein [Myxococcales bacterium]|nr:radical SAM protein [Myxococcales bacterium]
MAATSTDAIPTKQTQKRRGYWRPQVLAYGPHLAQLVITRRCNLTCGYCNEYDEVSPPVPTEVLKQRIDKLASFGTWFLEFSGGETLLHPDLIELVAYGARYKFFERWIITNGYLLSPEIVMQLNDAGLTHLQISVDGVTPNKTTVKTLKPLRKKIEHLQKHAKFTVQINAAIGAGNDEEVLEVMQFAREAGFRPRASVLHDGTGAMALDERGREILDKVAAAVGKRFSESGDYRAKLMATGAADYKCRAGSRYLYVDEFGDVNWCSQTRGVFKKALLDYTWDDLKGQFYTRKTCAPTCTLGCVRTASRLDEWRAQDREFVAPPPAPDVPVDALVRR